MGRGEVDQLGCGIGRIRWQALGIDWHGLQLGAGCRPDSGGAAIAGFFLPNPIALIQQQMGYQLQRLL